jgi:pyruvate-ferredoxin/flavodoxin oxidoreductase
MLKETGGKTFTLDSKAPTAPFKEFINGEVRYSQLMNVFPDIAGEMFDTAEKHASERYDRYKRMDENSYQ